MQTYTHGLIGLAAGTALFPTNPLLQGACAVGSMLPDLFIVPFWIDDVSHGKKPSEHQDRFERTVNEISHSLPLFLVFLACTVALGKYGVLPESVWYPLAVLEGGMLGHLFVDMFTHGNFEGKYDKVEKSMMWPFTRPHLSATFSFWDYRYDHGSIRPKPVEIAIMTGLTLFIAFMKSV